MSCCAVNQSIRACARAPQQSTKGARHPFDLHLQLENAQMYILYNYMRICVITCVMRNCRRHVRLSVFSYVHGLASLRHHLRKRNPHHVYRTHSHHSHQLRCRGYDDDDAVYNRYDAKHARLCSVLLCMEASSSVQSA